LVFSVFFFKKELIMATPSGRTSARTSARTSSKRMASAGGGGWRNSPIVGIVLGIVILIAVISLIKSQVGGGDSLIPANFPHTYLAEVDNGNYGALLIVRGQNSRPTPFTENGKEYWSAYICSAENCPGRAEDGKPYLFAGKLEKLPSQPMPEGAPDGYIPEDQYKQIECPLCRDAQDKARGSKKGDFQPYNVSYYQTEEGEKIIEKIREEYRKRATGR
jgi:hypothetical protein